MSTPLQTRLLRVLAEGEFYRVGGQTPVKVDVRVIAATHQDLEERVERGIFREDLLHRLNVIRIELPPLRSRTEDVPDLLAHYLRQAAAELGAETKTLAPVTLERLQAYRWPGNVRELVNLCRRLTALAPGSEIQLQDLPSEMHIVTPAAQTDWAAALTLWAKAQPLRRHGGLARPGAAGVRARADPRGAQSHARPSPGSRARARLGTQHADAQAQRTGHGGRRVVALDAAGTDFSLSPRSDQADSRAGPRDNNSRPSDSHTPSRRECEIVSAIFPAFFALFPVVSLQGVT